MSGIHDCACAICGAEFQRVHDVLLRWVKPRPSPRWTQLYEPLAPSTLKAFGGRRQRAHVEGGRRKRSTTGEEASSGAPMGDVWNIPVVQALGCQG